MHFFFRVSDVRFRVDGRQAHAEETQLVWSWDLPAWGNHLLPLSKRY